MPVFLSMVGFAIDTSRMILTRNSLQDATDAATLTAASAIFKKANTNPDVSINVATMTELVRNSLQKQLLNLFTQNIAQKLSTDAKVTIKKAYHDSPEYNIQAVTFYDMPLSSFSFERIISGHGSVTISTSSVSKAVLPNPDTRIGVSVEYVQDFSDSKKPAQYPMHETANSGLAQSLFERTDIDLGSYLLLGQTAYSSQVYSDDDSNGTLFWQTPENIARIKKGSPPTPGTNNYLAMRIAYDKLTSAYEASEQKKKKNKIVKKYVIAEFLTDNDDSTNDQRTLSLCKEMKQKGIRIFTYAYGDVSNRTKQLAVSCATSSDDSYTGNNEVDLDKFSKDVGINKIGIQVKTGVLVNS
ncbi:hypothetical protein RL73_00230 [Liberibacter crescens]|nr:hypothetical protein RL73_00230 [Liberibacter crescens]